jgi:signal transduction histidine kinase
MLHGRDAGGSGLGLAITRSLVEAMSGSVSVSSDGPGRGAVFQVRLTLATPDARPSREAG